MNLLAYGGPIMLVTFTGPGVARGLPWACIADGCEGACRETPGSGCSVCGCLHTDPSAAAEWNRTAQSRWSELHRRASQDVKRAGYEHVQIGGAWQMQGRGVLHGHLAEGFKWRHRAGTWAYVNALRARSAEFGFGTIDARDRDGKAGRSGVFEVPERAAAYLSGYLGNSSQFLAAIASENRPARLAWVSSKMTMQTGCTMRRLRRARYLYVIRSGRSIIALAGRLPEWFKDAHELQLVSSLLAAPAAP